MKTPLIVAFFAATIALNVNAIDNQIQFLAGIETAEQSNTAMSTFDLDKMQNILQTKTTGAVESWYNIDTTTHYDVTIGQHYSANQRPCVSYTLTIKHDSQTQDKALQACLNYNGQWIAS